MVDIYGTIGPSCSSQETLTEMFQAGMTGVRLNLSHISLRESAEQIEKLYAAAHTAGVNPILLIDMQGPELREVLRGRNAGYSGAGCGLCPFGKGDGSAP